MTDLKFFFAFSSRLLFVLKFEFLSSPFLLQSGWRGIPPEEVGSHAPRSFPCVLWLPSPPSHARVPFASLPSATESEWRFVRRYGDRRVPRAFPCFPWPPFLSFCARAPFVSFPSVTESETRSVGSSGITVYLEFFLPFAGLFLFLLAFKFLPFLFLLRRN